MLIKTKKKPRGRPFVKGVCPNPLGRGASIPVSKETRKYTIQTVADIYNKLSDMNRYQLRSITIDPAAPGIEVIVAKCLLRDMRNCTMNRTEVILSRIIGHVPVKQEFAGSGGSPLMPPSIVIQEVAAPLAQDSAPSGDAPTS